MLLFVAIFVLIILWCLWRDSNAESSQTSNSNIILEGRSVGPAHEDELDGPRRITAREGRLYGRDNIQRASPIISSSFHSKQDLRRLLSKAEEFVNYSRLEPLQYFYRDQSDDYYRSVLNENEGIMKVRLKDNHGDPKSPINGRLKGIFLGVNVWHGTGMPVSWSIYGPKRLKLDPESRYQTCKNLYFTDFYCISKPHTVTLVMTRPGSAADEFCKRHLIGLDWENNWFLERRQRGSFYVTSSGLWVEVFFTEDIDIFDGVFPYGTMLEDVPMTGQRSGGSVGLRKNSSCEICNID